MPPLAPMTATLAAMESFERTGMEKRVARRRATRTGS